MGIQKIENVKIVCDWCEEEITHEELDEVKDALNQPIAIMLIQFLFGFFLFVYDRYEHNHPKEFSQKYGPDDEIGAR